MRSQRVLNANFLPLFGDAVVVFLLLTDGLCSCCTQFVPRFTYWPTSLHFLILLLFPAHYTTTCSIFHALTYFLVSMQIRPFAGDWRLSVDSAHSLSRFFFCLQTDKQTHRQTRSNFSTPTFFCQLVSLNTNESFCFYFSSLSLAFLNAAAHLFCCLYLLLSTLYHGEKVQNSNFILYSFYSVNSKKFTV